MTETRPSILKRQNAPDLAYIYTEGTPDFPPVVFLGGFKSDMMGSKADFLAKQCLARGQSYLRLDYSGHGQSQGQFVQGCIGEWAQDAKDVIVHCTSSEAVILVGSSMGGWISLLIARDMPKKVKALVGIAAAPDFTTWMEAQMSDTQRQKLENEGRFEEPSDYDEPYIITKKLIDDGRQNLLLDKALKIDCPVRLLQGKQDTDVPWQTAQSIKEVLTSKDVKISYQEQGNHSLSSPEDLELLNKTILDLL